MGRRQEAGEREAGGRRKGGRRQETGRKEKGERRKGAGRQEIVFLGLDTMGRGDRLVALVSGCNPVWIVSLVWSG